MKSTIAAFLIVIAAPLHALIGDTPTIRAVAVVHGAVSDPLTESVALIGDTPEGVGDQLILRTVNRNSGSYIEQDPIISPRDSARAVDVIFSRVFRPDAILVLAEDLTVREYAVAFDVFGLPKLVGETPTIHGPFGDPAILGAGTVLAEAPNPIDPSDPFLAIGTARGSLLLVCPSDPSANIITAPGPVTGLGTVPQVGYFAFVAAQNGHVIGVNPSTAAVVFDLADPGPIPLVDLSTGAVFEPNGEPLKEPLPVPIVIANGTTRVSILQIPANPAIGGFLTSFGDIKGEFTIRGVEAGSLFLIADSGAVLYDPGFNFESGPSGVTFTIAGATADLDPDTLNLGSNGKFVTATIEVENGGADLVDAATPKLRYGPSEVPASAAFAPRVGDADGDGQADLLVKFDRRAVQWMLKNAPAGPLTLQLTWTYRDGSSGHATAVIRIQGQ
jgi:hypothetical protein